MAENVILAETTYEGFALNETYGAYHYGVNPAPFVLTEGETYTVVWDGVSYTCVCQSTDGLDGLQLGNMTSLGGTGNDEPFAVGWAEIGVSYLASDTATSHTVAIYQVVAEESDIVLKDRAGNDIEGLGVVAELKVPTADGGFKRYSAGTRVDKVMTQEEVDFSAGDITVTPGDGEVFKSVVVPKPDGLIPENIPKDVTIAGILGTKDYEVSSGEWLYVEGKVTPSADGTETVTHGLGVIPEMVCVYYSTSGALSKTTSKVYVLNGFMLGRKLFGDALSNIDRFGLVLMINPSTKYYLTGASSSPLEDMTSSSWACAYNATEETITLGTEAIPLMGGCSYSWMVYARK